MKFRSIAVVVGLFVSVLFSQSLFAMNAEDFRKAAEQGDASAQCFLGLCYENGNGVEKDSAEAVKWYRKAAEQGLKEAQYNLGLCYAYGYGVAKDSGEAEKWYRKAAEQGYESAKAELKSMSMSATPVATNAHNTETTQPESVFFPKNREATATPTKTTTSVETNIPNKSVNKNTTDSRDGGGYKNIPWNSSYEQVKDTLSDLGKLTTRDGYDSAESRTVDRTFYFINDKLVKVNKRFTAYRGHGIEELQEIREQLLKVLIQNYGLPSSAWGRTLGNQGYGNKSLLVLWNLPKGGIILEYYEVLSNGISFNGIYLDYLSPEEYEKKYNKVFVEEQKESVSPYQRLDREKVNVGL